MLILISLIYINSLWQDSYFINALCTIINKKEAMDDARVLKTRKDNLVKVVKILLED